jgi:hypothetical protein
LESEDLFAALDADAQNMFKLQALNDELRLFDEVAARMPACVSAAIAAALAKKREEDSTKTSAKKKPRKDQSDPIVVRLRSEKQIEADAKKEARRLQKMQKKDAFTDFVQKKHPTLLDTFTIEVGMMFYYYYYYYFFFVDDLWEKKDLISALGNKHITRCFMLDKETQTFNFDFKPMKVKTALEFYKMKRTRDAEKGTSVNKKSVLEDWMGLQESERQVFDKLARADADRFEREAKFGMPDAWIKLKGKEQKLWEVGDSEERKKTKKKMALKRRWLLRSRP